jgi:hypothetical protein
VRALLAPAACALCAMFRKLSREKHRTEVRAAAHNRLWSTRTLGQRKCAHKCATSATRCPAAAPHVARAARCTTLTWLQVLVRVVRDFAHAQASVLRLAFVSIAREMLAAFSASFFCAHVLPHLLPLSTDPSLAVRLALPAAMPDVKRTVRLPEGVGALERVNAAMSALLTDADSRVCSEARRMHAAFKAVPVRLAGVGVLDIHGASAKPECAPRAPPLFGAPATQFCMHGLHMLAGTLLSRRRTVSSWRKRPNSPSTWTRSPSAAMLQRYWPSPDHMTPQQRGGGGLRVSRQRILPILHRVGACRACPSVVSQSPSPLRGKALGFKLGQCAIVLDAGNKPAQLGHTWK